MTVIDMQERRSASFAPSPAIEITVVTSFDACGISRKEWDQFVLDVGGEIYSSYDWCRIWWRHYGRGRDLRLFMFRQDSRLVGLAPMFIERVWLGLFSIKIAKPVGSDFTMDVFGLPAVPSCVEGVCEQTVSHLIANDRCDAVWFGFVPFQHRSLDALRRLADGAGRPVAVARDASINVVTVFNLPGDFKSYLASLARGVRQNFNRRLNLLKQEASVEHVVVRGPSDPAIAFDAFSRLHTLQWQAEGRPGHFNDWPGSEAFNLELATELAKLGRLRIVNLHSDQRLVASQYAFTFGATGYWRLAARATDKELARYGLGVLGLMQLLEHMCGGGVRRVESGYGRYPYKVQCGAIEHPVTSLLLKSTRPLPSLRADAFVAMSRLIDLLYYRIWRLRIAPRLSIRRTPLWRRWIRLRM